MSKHTEGPWEVVQNHGAYVRRSGLVEHRIDQVGGLSELAVALVIADCPTLVETGQSEANSRLIAKSPEMYDFIRTISEYFVHDADRNEKCRDNCRVCWATQILTEIGNEP